MTQKRSWLAPFALAVLVGGGCSSLPPEDQPDVFHTTKHSTDGSRPSHGALVRLNSMYFRGTPALYTLT